MTKIKAKHRNPQPPAAPAVQTQPVIDQGKELMESSENTQQEQLDGAAGAEAPESTATADASVDAATAAACEVNQNPLSENTGETAAEGESAIDMTTQEGASEAEAKLIGVNVNIDMPQENDPIESGEMQETIDALSATETVTPAATPVADDAGDAPAAPAVDAGLPQAAAAELTEEEAFLADVAVNGTEVQKRMLNAICDFSFRLRPKAPIQPADCNKAQHEFLRHLQWLLKKDFNEFRQGWATLLIYFSVNHGTPTPRDYSALSEYSATRYMNHWSKSNEEAQLFTDLITLLRTTRNASTRKHNVKMISLEKIGVGLFTDKEISNLKQFYA